MASAASQATGIDQDGRNKVEPEAGILGKDPPEQDKGDVREDSVWVEKGDVLDFKHGKAFTQRKQVFKRHLEVNIRDLFRYIYEDGANIYTEFHKSVMGDWDVKITSWENVGGHRERTGSFKKKLNYTIGPKHTRVAEKSFLAFTSTGFRLEWEIHNKDVPMGSSFRVENYFDFHDAGEGQTICIGYTAVNFLAFNLLKGKIESGALKDTPGAYAKLLDFITYGMERYFAEKNLSKLSVA